MTAKKISMKYMDNIVAEIKKEEAKIGRPKLNEFPADKKITVSIPEEIHRRLRVEAAKTGRPMVELVCKALNDYLPKEV